MLKALFHFLLTMTLLTLLTGCSLDLTSPETISFVDDGSGFIRYSTNDRSLRGTRVVNDASVEVNYELGLTFTIKKISGESEAYYGLAACLTADGYYAILIDINRNHKLYYVDTTGSEEVWNLLLEGNSSRLNSGYDVENEIYVEYSHYISIVGIGTREIKELVIKFNGAIEYSITNPQNSGGSYGYVVEIHKAESFPAVPVDVRFKALYSSL